MTLQLHEFPSRLLLTGLMATEFQNLLCLGCIAFLGVALIIGGIAAKVALPSMCATDGSDYSYVESLSADGNTRKIVFNGCPNHGWASLNPNYPVSSSTTYNIPAKPSLSSTTPIDLSAQGGGTGILFDGAQVYSAFAGTTALTNYASSATALEGDTFDQCGEHAAGTFSASYHAHVPPACLLHQLGGNATAHSPQIGWSLDGFPIYGPHGPGGKMMKTCTAEGITDSALTPCVDDCVGRQSSTQPNDGYHYRCTPSPSLIAHTIHTRFICESTLSDRVSSLTPGITFSANMHRGIPAPPQPHRCPPHLTTPSHHSASRGVARVAPRAPVWLRHVAARLPPATLP